METRYKSLGILIPSRERIKLLKNLLYDLANSPGSNFLEVIVASDNCSETFNVIKEFPLQNNFLKYKALITPKRLYTVGTINFCLDHCDSYLFSWAANDIIINRKDWIRYSINKFKNFFPDGIGVMGLTSPGPACGLTSKKFVEYNDGELYHSGYKVHHADMEVGIRSVLMGRYLQLGIFGLMKHKGRKGDIPHVGGVEIYKMKLEDKRLYGERMKEKFHLDPKKIKNPEIDEMYRNFEDGIFDWPLSLNISF